MVYFIQIYQSQRFPDVLGFINLLFIVSSNATVDCAVIVPGKRPGKQREDGNKRPNIFGSLIL